MIRGLYTAASGMMVESVRQETIANNLANSETTGFKRDLAIQRSFPELPVIRIGEGGRLNRFKAAPVIGVLGLGSLVDRIYTLHEQGSLVESSRPLDVALFGDGFFTVETPQGRRFTRNGAFSLDAERYLVTEQGFRVLGTGGPLRVEQGEVVIDNQGNVFSDGVLQGRLELVSFAETAFLRKEGGGLYTAGEGAEELAFEGQVRQGYLESANVQVVQEMARMLAALRAYETNQRVIQAQDEILGKAVNEVGSLR